MKFYVYCLSVLIGLLTTVNLATAQSIETDETTPTHSINCPDDCPLNGELQIGRGSPGSGGP